MFFFFALFKMKLKKTLFAGGNYPRAVAIDIFTTVLSTIYVTDSLVQPSPMFLGGIQNYLSMSSLPFLGPCIIKDVLTQ